MTYKQFRGCILCLGVVLTYVALNVIEYYRTVNVTHFQEDSLFEDRKVILLWNSMFSKPDYVFGFGNYAFSYHNCPVNNCMLTNDKLYMPQHLFHAIIFHGFEYFELFQGKPWNRGSYQYYIFTTLESSKRTPIPSTFSNFYNLSMTYRLDSDIPWTYFRIKDFTGNIVGPSENMNWPSSSNFVDKIDGSMLDIIAGKTRKVVWFVSNCKSTNGREKYVNDLQKYIEVDVYGKCGPLSCPASRGQECFNMLRRDYFFYVSFENSHCVDYITEKVMTALQNDVVPIVYGGANYSNFLPPYSYIDANIYSPAELARKLNGLIENPTLYMRYFWWKHLYKYESTMPWSIHRDGLHPFCKLCEILNDPNYVTNKSDNVRDWWLGVTTDSVCVPARY